ncbi:unnamed protein product [Timema podura]|uniref:T-complex protein 1 subunit alpha n=1 Tax=Timema podura TaxID=61482 RepID=A0ABN7NY16_TIMPD|nr:unnamed protein product [Timema podura]
MLQLMTLEPTTIVFVIHPLTEEVTLLTVTSCQKLDCKDGMGGLAVKNWSVVKPRHAFHPERLSPFLPLRLMAACSIANIVKSSLGPVGLDKMLVDDIGDVTVTNDGATILRLLEVEHPAARVLVELAQLQDDEVGDGTTSVVIVAAELLKNADDLVKQKIHPTSIISGYRIACRLALPCFGSGGSLLELALMSLNCSAARICVVMKLV